MMRLTVTLQLNDMAEITDDAPDELELEDTYDTDRKVTVSMEFKKNPFELLIDTRQWLWIYPEYLAHLKRKDRHNFKEGNLKDKNISPYKVYDYDSRKFIDGCLKLPGNPPNYSEILDTAVNEDNYSLMLLIIKSHFQICPILKEIDLVDVEIDWRSAGVNHVD